MELDFDKEIDALIRREGAARTITIGEFAGLHPDADEIAAFVENAIPAATRAALIGHFGECDLCRRVLTNTITVNSETVSAVSEGVAAPVETASVPWYRRLFMFPNLAYVMGSLIVLFGGFIGLSVFNSYQNSASDISQMRASEPQPAAAPAQPESFGNANAAPVAANSSNTSVAANTAASPAMTNTAHPTSAANTAANTAAANDRAFTLDGVSTQPQQPALAQAPAKNEPKPEDKLNEVSKDDRKAAVASKEKESKREEQALMAKKAPAPAGAPMKTTGPTRSERDARAAESAISSRRVEDLPATGRGSDPNKKQVSGKTFEFRQGAWYDTTYRGQGTITVRRNTDAYRKLDGGLRGIAESFFGTVVTIWNGKAYRIQ